MPSKKKKYNARFPAGRIKKIMQTDEEVGKVAQAVPVIIYILLSQILNFLRETYCSILLTSLTESLPRTLELFVESLLTKTMQITSAKNAKTLSPSHMKQCILSESRFDFLKDLVKGLPDVGSPDDDVPTPPPTPAPQLVHGQMTSVIYPPIPRPEIVGSGRDVVPPAAVAGMIRQNSREMRAIGFSSPSAVTSEAHKHSAPVPSPHPGLSTPFNVSQPNFYTEVNPINLSKNSSNNKPVNLVTTKSTSSYSNTANIDEDYDT